MPSIAAFVPRFCVNTGQSGRLPESLRPALLFRGLSGADSGPAATARPRIGKGAYQHDFQQNQTNRGAGRRLHRPAGGVRLCRHAVAHSRPGGGGAQPAPAGGGVQRT